MKPQLIVIDSLDEFEKLRVYLADKTYIAFDTETTGLTAQHEIIGYSVCAEESKAYYVILAKWSKELNKLTYIPELIQESTGLIQDLSYKSLIMHNGSFDCMMSEAYFKVRLIDSLHTDTMILAHLLNENRSVGLKELAAEYYGEDSRQEQKEMKESVTANGGVLNKQKYELYKADAYLLAKYGAKDALLTFKLFNDLFLELHEQGLEKFFYEDESMPLLRGPTYDLNTTGLQIDTKALLTLKKTLQAECLEAKNFIYQEIHEHIKEKYPGTNKRNHFNIGASQQLAWLLFGKLGLEFNTLTKGGKEICKSLSMKIPYTITAKRDFIAMCNNAKGSTHQQEAIVNGKKIRAKKIRDPWAYIAVDAETLKKLAPKLKWVQKLIEYNKKTKLLTTYVEGIEERIQYGIIRPNFLQHGTTSGRYSARNPNFQNLPRDDKSIKSIITARKCRSFVGADYSQLEPRVFAYFSADKRLLEAFNGVSDFYSVIGMEVYDKLECVPLKEGDPKAFGKLYPKLRQDAKVFTLAATYGATASRLAGLMGKSRDGAQDDLDNYFEKFPGVKGLMDESHTQARTNGYVTNFFGRPRRMPEAKNIKGKNYDDLTYEFRNILNLAVNHRIQSTAASIVNRAAIKMHNDCKEAGIDCRLVLQVHDSLVIECNDEDADNVAILLKNAMETAIQLEGIRFEALPKVGKSLADV